MILALLAFPVKIPPDGRRRSGAGDKLRAFRIFVRRALILLLAAGSWCRAQDFTGAARTAPLLNGAPDAVTVEHVDPIEIDPSLTLAGTVQLTLEQYPDNAWLTALEEEAGAIAGRGESWTAGASQAELRFQEAASGTLHYTDAVVTVPLWNRGQRDAQKILADYAAHSAEAQARATRLRVAGLVRNALWDMALRKVRFEQAKADADFYEQLLEKIKLQVGLGDLPRSDILLTRTELLQRQSLLTQAEAEWMHSRKRYAILTRMTRAPAHYQEKLADPTQIEQTHPVLAAVNSQIERKQSELEAVKLIGSGQTHLAVGVNSDRPSNNDPRSNNTESFNIAMIMPFGGSAHLAPQIAAVNVELNRLLAERQLLYRELEQARHEAQHNLEVNRAELEIAAELRKTAEEHLQMMNISFAAGEIGLLDLLRIQSRTQQAVLSARERAVILERDKAFYNQAAGVMP